MRFVRLASEKWYFFDFLQMRLRFKYVTAAVGVCVFAGKAAIAGFLRCVVWLGGVYCVCSGVLLMIMDDDRPCRVADFARLAEARAMELRAEGEELYPVVASSRKLADHFWGSAWMKNLARCEAGGLCLSPGRSLLRHGCVLDARVAPGCIRALVSAQELYEVEIAVDVAENEHIEHLRALCSGHISSLVALLEGTANDALLRQLCEPESGLLPAPEHWHMRCSCPDWAEPCPHAAAAIYAAGVLIDRDPSLLFTLRQLDAAALIALPSSPAVAMDAASLSSTFGIHLDLGE